MLLVSGPRGEGCCQASYSVHHSPYLRDITMMEVTIAWPPGEVEGMLQFVLKYTDNDCQEGVLTDDMKKPRNPNCGASVSGGTWEWPCSASGVRFMERHLRLVCQA